MGDIRRTIAGDTLRKHTPEVKTASESASASGYWTDKVGLISAATGTGKLCGGSGDLLLLDLENGREPWHALRGGVVVGACARLGF